LNALRLFGNQLLVLLKPSPQEVMKRKNFANFLKITVADMKSFGFSRLCQPRKYGEAELPLNVAIDVLSILADGCASTA